MKLQEFFKIKDQKKILISLLFFSFAFLLSYQINAQEKDFIVVLDAGHGGKDPGKVGYKNLKEKEVALSIVLKVGKLLEKEKNIKVVYTRKTDVFVDLWERGRIANKANADLFVSVHCNAHTSQAYGSETWVLGTHANKQNFEVAKTENSVIFLEDDYKVNYKGFDPNSPESVIGLLLMQEEYLDQSIQLASIIQDDFTNVLKRKNRGVKQAGFIVLHQTYMPSVLIETGFISNKNESAYLKSQAGQDKFAESIYRGVMKYLNQLQINTVADNSIPSQEIKKEVASVKEANQKKSNENVIFKVQIAAGSKKLDTKPYNFKGLEPIERLKVGNLYKYYFGSSSSYKEIEKILKKARKKGYSSAFIVAFKNNKKINLTDDLKKS